MARKISATKRRHEAHRHTRSLLTTIYQYSAFIKRVDTQTITIASDGAGQFYIPSLDIFQRLVPNSAPMGIIFHDGSFLTIKEIFRYDYVNAEVEPRIIRSEFSYHYQSPPRQFFFRYDYHPEIGNLTTHPLYHLHVGCWHTGIEKFPGTPRFRAPEVSDAGRGIGVSHSGFSDMKRIVTGMWNAECLIGSKSTSNLIRNS